MPSPQKKFPAGPILVVGILLVATLGAGLTWRQYSLDHPSAVRASLLAADRAEAEFSPEVAAVLPMGSKVIVSVSGVRSTGYVSALEERDGRPVFVLTLLEPFADGVAGTPCQVTVDRTLPPEGSKER